AQGDEEEDVVPLEAAVREAAQLCALGAVEDRLRGEVDFALHAVPAKLAGELDLGDHPEGVEDADGGAVDRDLLAVEVDGLRAALVDEVDAGEAAGPVGGAGLADDGVGLLLLAVVEEAVLLLQELELERALGGQDDAELLAGDGDHARLSCASGALNAPEVRLVGAWAPDHSEQGRPKVAPTRFTTFLAIGQGVRTERVESTGKTCPVAAG